MYVPYLFCDNPGCQEHAIVQENRVPHGWIMVSPGGYFCSYTCVGEFVLAAMEASAQQREAHADEEPALADAEPAAVVATRPA